MNLMLFTALLVRNRLVDRLAFEDPEGWDGGVTESRAAAAYEELFPQPPARQEGDTPRTEAVVRRDYFDGCDTLEETVEADFARTLERELSAKQAEVERLRNALKSNENGITFEDYEEVLESHRALVREIDGILFGENAAKQAILCDLVHPIRKFKDELESLKAAQGWREIETAPKDGTKVDLWGCEKFLISGRKVAKRWSDCYWLEDGGFSKWTNRCGDSIDVTHWMPIPTPPVERSGE